MSDELLLRNKRQPIQINVKKASGKSDNIVVPTACIQWLRLPEPTIIYVAMPMAMAMPDCC